MKNSSRYLLLFALTMCLSCNTEIVSLNNDGGATDTPNALIHVIADCITGKAKPGGIVKIVNKNYNAFDKEGYIDSTVIGKDSSFTFDSMPSGVFSIYVLYNSENMGVRIENIKISDEVNDVIVSSLDTLGNISGVVYQSNSTEGAENICICLDGSDFNCITNERGKYVIPNVPIGSYSAILRRNTIPGKNPTKTSRIDLNISNRNVVMDFML